jgi:glycosyltransferase involved in cell wall biosynthesis
MIEGRTILCFASGYDAPPTSKHHVMHLLAERNTVLWINYHGSRTPTARASDLRAMARKLSQVLGGLTRPRENLFVLTPLVVPLPTSRWARRVNQRLLIGQVRSALSALRAGPVQVWTFTPDVSYVLGNFAEERVVYYCVDDFAQFSGYDRQQVLRDEADLCRKADLVVTTSTALHEAKRPLNCNTLLIPHGVDYDHFSKALRSDLRVPADIAPVPRPRLGFFGLIRDWVDLDLLADVAQERPDWHVVILGDSTVDLSPYRKVANMHLLGRRPYEALPAYCKAFDVGLIPFRINELTLAVNPIKLREYLAAGLPVVSTPLPEVARYGELVRTAESSNGFIQAVSDCLGDPPRRREERSAAMATETWAAKVEEVCAGLARAGRPGRDVMACSV